VLGGSPVGEQSLTGRLGVRLSRQRWIYLRDLLREAIARDIKLRYRRSIVGLAWTLLNPLTELLVLLFVFGVVLPLNIPNYPAFLFTGILAYGWFQFSLFFATGAIVNNRDLIRRPGFPAAILPIVTVTSNLIHFLLALPILFALLFLSRIMIGTAILVLPLLIAIQFTFTLGLAYLVATCHVWFRDVQYILRVLLQFLFFLTPVFYQASAIPDRYESLYHLNPMVFVVDAYRTILIQGEVPDPRSMLILSLVAVGLLLVGLSIFTRANHRFVDEL
jgi:lipopolysaccharide transport system permease protein